MKQTRIYQQTLKKPCILYTGLLGKYFNSSLMNNFIDTAIIFSFNA